MKLSVKKLPWLVIAAIVATPLTIMWNSATADTDLHPQIWVKDTCTDMDIGVLDHGWPVPLNINPPRPPLEFGTTGQLHSGHSYDTISFTEPNYGDRHFAFNGPNQNATIGCLEIYENPISKTCSWVVTYSFGSECNWPY